MTSSLELKKASVHNPLPCTLKEGVLSGLETLAQSIAGIAPSATPGILLPIVFAFAGNGSWLCYLLATIGILFTARCINIFASRQSCPGSLSTFTKQGLGNRAGILCGWSLLFAYILCTAACLTEFALYAISLKQHMFDGLNLVPSNIFNLVLIMGCAAITVYIAWKNIKMSAILMLRLEFFSLAMILIVVLLSLIRFGLKLDLAQLQLESVSPEQIRIGLVMSIFGFVAFESSASLGKEAADPLKTIPNAISRSVLISGIFFVITAYCLVLVFHDSSIPLNKSETPLLFASTRLGVPLLGHLIDLGIMLSFFAAGLANLNAGARSLYKMSINGLLPGFIAKTHVTNQTPHIAIGIVGAIGLTTALVLSFLHSNLLDIVGWLGTLATFGFIWAYLSATLSAAFFLRKIGELSFTNLAVVLVSSLVLIFALLGSLYPAPQFPYNLLPFIFGSYMIAGWFWLGEKPGCFISGNDQVDCHSLKTEGLKGEYTVQRPLHY